MSSSIETSVKSDYHQNMENHNNMVLDLSRKDSTSENYLKSTINYDQQFNNRNNNNNNNNNNNGLILPQIPIPMYPIYYQELARQETMKLQKFSRENNLPELLQNINTKFEMLKNERLVEEPKLLQPIKIESNNDVRSITPLSENQQQQQQLLPTPPPNILDNKKKGVRPFKAYPRDPLAIAASFAAVDAYTDTTVAQRYTLYRRRMLDGICAANGGHRSVCNPKMRRTGIRRNTTDNDGGHTSNSSENEGLSIESGNETNPDSNFIINNNNNNDDIDTMPTIDQIRTTKDAAYYERRRKNNAAAKKSRDRRRNIEDEIAIRAAFLERENIELKFEIAAIKKELSSLRGNN